MRNGGRRWSGAHCGGSCASRISCGDGAISISISGPGRASGGLPCSSRMRMVPDRLMGVKYLVMEELGVTDTGDVA